VYFTLLQHHLLYALKNNKKKKKKKNHIGKCSKGFRNMNEYFYSRDNKVVVL